MAAQPDFSRLTPAEREVLALLAEGHTIKSIAAATGRSEGSLNERLREARRKTGVGSSRELARLVYARENRDGQIGVPAPPPVAPGPGRVPLWARLLGVLIMTIAIGSLIAVALQLPTPEAPAPKTVFQAAVGTHYGEAASWRAEMQVQPRNAAWADTHEAVLRRRYAAIPGLDMASLHVTCRESKCEVFGRSVAGASAATLKRATDELVSPAMRSSLAADGLHAAFVNCCGRDVSREIAFLTYWVSPDD